MAQVLKSRSDLSRCAIFRPATAKSRFSVRKWVFVYLE
jgi:hypothetical protein